MVGNDEVLMNKRCVGQLMVISESLLELELVLIALVLFRLIRRVAQETSLVILLVCEPLID